MQQHRPASASLGAGSRQHSLSWSTLTSADTDFCDSSNLFSPEWNTQTHCITSHHFTSHQDPFHWPFTFVLWQLQQLSSLSVLQTFIQRWCLPICLHLTALFAFLSSLSSTAVMSNLASATAVQLLPTSRSSSSTSLFTFISPFFQSIAGDSSDWVASLHNCRIFFAAPPSPVGSCCLCFPPLGCKSFALSAVAAAYYYFCPSSLLFFFKLQTHFISL